MNPVASLLTIDGIALNVDAPSRKRAFEELAHLFEKNAGIPHREAFDACQDVFAAMGTNIIYEGSAGKGQHTKMANQIALAGAVASVSEAIAYARRTGLDVETMLASISKGAAGSWQMTNNAPKMVAGDMAPGFFIKHFIKDMAIADEEAKAAGLTMPVLEEVLEMYRELDRRGEGDLGTQAVIHYFDEK